VNPLAENLPDDSTKAMSNGPDGFRVPDAGQQAQIRQFEDAAFALDRRVRTLIQKTPHVAIALRRPVALGFPRTLLFSGTDPHPRGKVFLGTECRRGGSHLGNDLMRRIHTQTRHFRQSLDRILVCAEQFGEFLVQLFHLMFDQIQFLQRHLDEPPVDRVEFGCSTERVAQLFRRSAQALVGHGSQNLRAGLPVAQCRQHTPGTGAQQIRN
jgi:hypothetical protein